MDYSNAVQSCQFGFLFCCGGYTTSVFSFKTFIACNLLEVSQIKNSIFHVLENLLIQTFASRFDLNSEMDGNVMHLDWMIIIFTRFRYETDSVTSQICLLEYKTKNIDCFVNRNWNVRWVLITITKFQGSSFAAILLFDSLVSSCFKKFIGVFKSIKNSRMSLTLALA